MQHKDIEKMMSALDKAEIVNLDASIRSLVSPIAANIPRDPEGTVSIHVLCCNEYFLVTGLTGEALGPIEEHAGAIRKSTG